MSGFPSFKEHIVQGKPFRSILPEVFLKSVVKICSKFTEERPWGSVISPKLLSNFIKIPLPLGYSPVNVLHIFRTPFIRTPLEECIWHFSGCFQLEPARYEQTILRNLNFVQCSNVKTHGLWPQWNIIAKAKTLWPQWKIPSWFIAPMEKAWFYGRFPFEVLIVIVKDKTIQRKIYNVNRKKL